MVNRPHIGTPMVRGDLTVYKRALYRRVYRLLPCSTTYRATIHVCSPRRTCLRRAADTRTDADGDSGKVPKASLVSTHVASSCTRSDHSVRRGCGQTRPEVQ